MMQNHGMKKCVYFADTGIRAVLEAPVPECGVAEKLRERAYQKPMLVFTKTRFARSIPFAYAAHLLKHDTPPLSEAALARPAVWPAFRPTEG